MIINIKKRTIENVENLSLVRIYTLLHLQEILLLLCLGTPSLYFRFANKSTLYNFWNWSKGVVESSLVE
jgi:hypothetical protein